MAPPRLKDIRFQRSLEGGSADLDEDKISQRPQRRTAKWKSKIPSFQATSLRSQSRREKQWSLPPSQARTPEAQAEPSSRGTPPGITRPFRKPWHHDLNPEDEFASSTDMSQLHQNRDNAELSGDESDEELRPMIQKISLSSARSHNDGSTSRQLQEDVEMGESGRLEHTGPHAAQRLPDIPTPVRESNSASSGQDNNGVTITASQLNFVISKLTTLSDGIDGVSGTLKEQYSSLLTKIQDLEKRVPDEEPPVLSPRKKQKPYKRRSKAEIEFAARVRAHLDSLLDVHEDPFVDEDVAEQFQEEVEESPEARCCDVNYFQIDIAGGPHSAWNTSAALVFTENYLQTKEISEDRSKAVTEAFFTRVKSIRQESRQTPRKKARKATYLRKYTLFQRRLETVASVSALKKHAPLLQKLGVEGMSSDEEEDIDVGFSMEAMKGRQGYNVVTPRWRSKDLTAFLHVIDSIHLLQRRLDIGRQRGNWPRPRLYDPSKPRVSDQTHFPKNLPRNAYDGKWLGAFPNVSLSVAPGAEYDLLHPPEVFHFLATQSPQS